jgi:hypothetical protein
MVTCVACKTTKQHAFGDVKVLEKNGDIMKVFVRFTGQVCCERETDEYFKLITAVYDKKRRFQILYDTTHITGLPSKDQFNKQVKFMREKDEQTRVLVEKAAIVAPQVKNMLKLLFAIKKAACDTKVCDTLEQARAYLNASKKQPAPV